MATNGEYGPEGYKPPKWFWQIVATRFLEGAVKPWEWDDVPIEWVSRVSSAMEAIEHAREVREKEQR